MNEKKTDLDKTINTFNQKDNVIFKPNAELSLHHDALNSGSLRLDAALGGGFVLGRLYELFGPESSGKTTVALHAMAAAQEKGHVLLMDMEHAFDPRYAESLGVDLDKLYVAQPDSQESCFEIMETLCATGQFSMVVLDSVAGLSPQAELVGDSGDSNMGIHARNNGQHLRKMLKIAAKTKTVVIYINQMRSKIGLVFGNPDVTTGGNAFKYFCSARLDIRRIKTLKNADTVYGIRSRVRVVKNKTYIPHLEAEFDIKFGVGVDKYAEIIEMAVEKGVVEKSGSWYSYKEDRMGQGINAAIEYIKEANIYDQLKKELFSETTVEQ